MTGKHLVGTEEAPERAYAAPVGAMVAQLHLVSAPLLRPDGPGKPALMQVEPPVEYVTLEGSVSTNRWGRRLHIVTRAGPDTTLMQVSGSIRPRSKPLRIARRIYDPKVIFRFGPHQFFTDSRALICDTMSSEVCYPQGRGYFMSIALRH